MPTVEATFRESRVAALFFSCVPWALGFFQPRISTPWHSPFLITLWPAP